MTFRKLYKRWAENYWRKRGDKMRKKYPHSNDDTHPRQCFHEMDSTHEEGRTTYFFCVKMRGHEGPHDNSKVIEEKPKPNRRGLVAHSRAQA